MGSDWSSGLDLLVHLDRAAGLREGIERALRDGMRAGRLPVGSTLPSSRSLARDLGVARGTVSAAYRQLAAEGYLELRQGAPVRVRWTPRHRPPSPPPPAQPGTARWDFRPGQPDSASFPRQAWARACRQVLAAAPDEVFGYGDPRGTPELRRALAEYLGRARGVDTSPEQLLICSGFTQALALICHILRAAGATLAVEDPGPHRYRRLAEAADLAVVPVPCDQDGLEVGHLDRSGARAVLVTPAHQYPLGITMSPARRTALVEWARRRQALIIEDDYDGEFRYDQQPAGALQHLDPGHVIYVGTTSKTLAPALRLGWLSPPPSIGAAITAAKEYADRGTSVLDQLTLAQLIAGGAFDRHVRRMRGIYRHRRDDLAQAMARSHAGVHLTGISAGLHVLARLPQDGPTEQQIRSRAARRSIALHTLGRYWHNPPQPAPQAVIIGYATPAGHAYRPALSVLTQLLTDPR